MKISSERYRPLAGFASAMLTALLLSGCAQKAAPEPSRTSCSEWKADQRFGTAAVKNAGVWEWGDADHAMNFWATALDNRLVKLGIQNTGALAAAN